jgi:uncharacterized membrane protein YebE (DUF533 family)
MEARMLNAKTLLDTVMGSLTQATGGKGAKGLTDKAKETWNNQSTLGKGAIAGGLLGILLTQGGRRMLGTSLKIGGMAAIGGLAYKAYEDWKAGRSAGETTALPKPDGTGFLPDDAEGADMLATHLLQAMIAAAKADGHVTPDERARIDGQLDNLGLGDEALALITAELDAPLDVGRIAALAGSAASLLAVDVDNEEERAYLSSLAQALRLDPGLVEHLHAEAERL